MCSKHKHSVIFLHRSQANMLSSAMVRFLSCLSLRAPCFMCVSYLFFFFLCAHPKQTNKQTKKTMVFLFVLSCVVVHIFVFVCFAVTLCGFTLFLLPVCRENYRYSTFCKIGFGLFVFYLCNLMKSCLPVNSETQCTSNKTMRFCCIVHKCIKWLHYSLLKVILCLSMILDKNMSFRNEVIVKHKHAHLLWMLCVQLFYWQLWGGKIIFWKDFLITFSSYLEQI